MSLAWATLHLKLSSCVRCRRLLTRVDRRYDQPRNEPDWCRFCGVPMSDKAKELRRPPGVATHAEMQYG